MNQSLNLSLTKGIEETCKADKLFIHFSSTYLGTSQLKNEIPCFITSFCDYSSTCSCETSYIGRTIRRLCDKVCEHHPVWLSKGQVRTTYTKAILNHLIESNHNVDIINPGQSSSPIIDFWGNLCPVMWPRVAPIKTIRGNSESPLAFSWFNWVVQSQLIASPSEFKCLLMIVLTVR